MAKEKDIFSLLKESFEEATSSIDRAAELRSWILLAKLRIDIRRYPRNAQLVTYIEQEIDKIRKIESCSIKIGLYRELIEYIVSQKSQIQNPLFHEWFAESNPPNGKIDRKNNSVEWQEFNQVHSIEEVASYFFSSLFKKFDKFGENVSDRLGLSFMKISCQNTLVQQYIKKIESLMSEENLSGLSSADRKQVLIKLSYIQEITATYKEDIQNFFYLPITRSRLLERLYYVKQLQQEIDRTKSNGKNNNTPGVTEHHMYDKKNKFRKAMEFFSDAAYVFIDYASIFGGRYFAKVIGSVGNTEMCYLSCKQLINQITGQQELIDEYLELIKGLASVESWDILTPEQKQSILESLKCITNDAVVYNDAVVAVKPFDHSVPLSKSILQTKLTELGKVVEQLEEYVR